MIKNVNISVHDEPFYREFEDARYRFKAQVHTNIYDYIKNSDDEELTEIIILIIKALKNRTGAQK